MENKREKITIGIMGVVIILLVFYITLTLVYNSALTRGYQEGQTQFGVRLFQQAQSCIPFSLTVNGQEINLIETRCLRQDGN